MEQALALEILLAGESALLTGPAGSGKTYVLNQFIKRAKADGKHVSVTATTGLAATHLNGSTIHAWSGMGIHDTLPRNHLEYMPKGRRDIIEKTDVLIIDEISMLHDYRLDLVDQIAREVRGTGAPFGGIQVVLCGDFFQLPPVNRNDSRQGGFVVGSYAWNDLDPVICYLSEQHRQDDDDFLEILNALRANDIRRRHVEALLTRQHADIGEDSEITELFTTNMDVDAINYQRLKDIDSQEVIFHMETTGKENYVETLKRSCLVPEYLLLKKGALVMCTKNNPEKKYVNGSIGVVVDFEAMTGYPRIELKDGRIVTISPEAWELRDGDTKRASLVQIPLRLAWAITVHKSQGMTLDAARVDLRRAFVEGMGYVALSRVRSLQTLSLRGINQMALRVSPEALEIDRQLKSKAKTDAERFAHLREAAAAREAEEAARRASGKDEVKQAEKAGKAGSWAAKLEKMRLEYPNAYRPWTKAHDEKLQTSFNGGAKLSDLAKELGRHPGSIRKRLEKLFGQDVVVS